MKLGRYEIEEEIGRGGFGRVYRALDPIMGRLVAIKVLEAEGGEEVWVRFRNEAAAAGSLRHKNIVTIYDYGEDRGRAYIVMEMLEGKDLRTAIAESASVGILQKLEVISQAAEGLYAAHQHGVFHRDIKPANIMLLPDGAVKLMDFGIARWTRDMATRLTRTGYLIGTINYMAPEQFKGIEPDNRADIFALGVVAYEFITGKHPFEDPYAAATMYNISHEDPLPPSQLNCDCTDELERLILRALKKDRDLRYLTADDLLLDLQSILQRFREDDVSKMLVAAEKALSNENSEEAILTIRKILKFEPTHLRARDLRRQAELQIQQRKRKQQSLKLITEAQEKIQVRDFPRAVQLMEEAARLDPGIQTNELLAEAKNRAEDCKRAGVLSAEAEDLISRGEITRAQEIAEKAVAVDPDHPDVLKLFETVQLALTERERRRKIDEMAATVRGLIRNRDFDSASESLNQLRREFPEANELSELSEYLRQEQADHQQLLALKNLALDLLRSEKYEECIANLESLANKLPDDHEIPKLLDQAQHGLGEQRFGRAIENLRGLIPDLLQEAEFGRALEAVRHVEMEFGSRNDLAGLVDQVLAAQEEYDRKRRVQQAVQECEELLRRHQFDEAITKLKEVQAEYPGDQAIEELRNRAEEEFRAHCRAEEVSKLVARARQLATAGEIEEAVSLIENAERDYSNEVSISAAAVEIRQAQAEARHRRDVAAALEQGEELLASQNFDAAFHHLETARRTLGAGDDLIDLEQRIQRSWREHKRHQEIESISESVRELIERDQLAKAVPLLETALQQHPGEPDLVSLLDRAKALQLERKRLAQAEQAHSEAARLLDQDDPDAAVALLERAVADLPESTKLSASLSGARSKQAAKRREAGVLEILTEARRYVEAKAFSRALYVIEGGLNSYPHEERLQDCAREISEAKTAFRREQKISSVLRNAEKLEKQKQFGNAIKVLTHGLQDFPEETRLVGALQRLREAWEQQQRAEAALKTTKKARILIEEKHFQAAIGLLEEFSDKHQESSEVKIVLETARKRKHDYDQEIGRLLQRAADLAEQKEFMAALQGIEDALVSFPNESRLKHSKEEIEQSRQVYEREVQLREKLREVALLEQNGRLEQAKGVLEQTLESLGESPDLTSSLKRVQQLLAQRQREQGALAEVARSRDLLGTDLTEALKLLQQAVKDYPESSELVTLLAEAKEQYRIRAREEEIRRLSADAKDLLAQGHHGQALRILDEGLQRYPEEETLLRDKESAETIRKRYQYEQELSTIRRKCDKLARQDRFSEGIQFVDAALVKHSNESSLLQLRSQLVEQNEQRERELQLQSDLKALKAAEKDIRKASAKPDRLVSLRSLLAEIRERQVDAESIAQRCDALLNQVDLALEIHDDGRVPASPSALVGFRKWIYVTVVLGVVTSAVWYLSKPRSTEPIASTSVDLLLAEDSSAVAPDDEVTPPVSVPVDSDSGSPEGSPDPTLPSPKSDTPESKVPQNAPVLPPVRAPEGAPAPAAPGDAQKADEDRSIRSQAVPPLPVPKVASPAEKSPPPASREDKEIAAWEGVRASSNPSDIQRFLRDFPNGNYARAARQRLGEIAWQQVRGSNDVSVIEAFRQKNPKGPFDQEAVNRIRQIQESAWSQLSNSENEAEIAAFLRQYPDGPFAPQARNRLSELRQRQERGDILKVLAAYAAAWSSKDLDTIVRLRPTFSSRDRVALEETFKMAQSLQMRLTPLQQPVIDARWARVNASQTTSITADRGRHLANTVEMEIVLRRAGDGWVIDSMAPR